MSLPFPTASIVINTLNRGRYLNDALLALTGLDYPSFEVIVVNGPSSDNTAEVIDGWRGVVKALDCPDANLSMSRNIGIAAAGGDIICFMDDDAAPHPAWLKRLATVYSDPEVGGVGGFTIDNTGVRWQVRKTVCDRYGNAYNVSQYFDERPLSRPGTPYYPSLLGTNSSFRASALRGIGGFDETFAYLLDETDVCLRLVDAGWKIQYEPTALIYHQFAESHIRSNDRVARTLYPSARSKSYFVMTHGSRHNTQQAGAELASYREEIARANQWLEENGKIDGAHRFSLDEDLHRGISEGVERALRGNQNRGDLRFEGDLPEFESFVRAGAARRRIALVSRGYPPDNDTGIARWTKMVADELSKRGHHVHVLTESGGQPESVSFRDGIWLHRIDPAKGAAGPFSEKYNIPEWLASWSARVWQEVQLLKSFGLEIVSFPIWDVEGIPLLDDPDITTVVSLHTTYAMAKPFKPEWNVRPLYEHHFVNRVIAAEREIFERAPVLLANSEAIIDEIENVYGVSISDRSPLVPHGTPDPLITRAERQATRNEKMRSGSPLKILYVGRFEQRKGFDIAVQVANRLVQSLDAEITFVGDQLTERQYELIASLDAQAILTSPRVSFAGHVDRSALDDAYVDSDIVLMPSRFESFGLVAIEAMAAGRPVIALRVGGLAEVASEENGCISIVEDGHEIQTFADEIAKLDCNRDVLAKRGLMARQSFENSYSATVMASGIERVYEAAHGASERMENKGGLANVG